MGTPDTGYPGRVQLHMTNSDVAPSDGLWRFLHMCEDQMQFCQVQVKFGLQAEVISKFTSANESSLPKYL